MPDLIYNFEGYVLRIAKEDYILPLLEFQKSFHVYEESKVSATFFYHIENDPFSQSDFEKIIIRQECIIAEKDGELIGYILIDSCSETQCLGDHQRYITHFVEEEYLDPESRMAPRLAELFNPEYINEDLERYMFSMLVHISKHKYDALFCSILMREAELMEKLQLGWKIVFENGMYCFMHWDNKTEHTYEQK